MGRLCLFNEINVSRTGLRRFAALAPVKTVLRLMRKRRAQRAFSTLTYFLTRTTTSTRFLHMYYRLTYVVDLQET